MDPAASEAIRPSLRPMLEARSVAVVGASVKAGSLGEQMMVELARGGFPGDVYPVNPSYDEVLGRRCYPSVADLPAPVDLAIIGVANQRVERALADAVAAGARSAVTFSSLHGIADSVAAIARDAGIPLCGGNGMGFLNLDRDLRATGFATPDRLRPGPVTFISHSGSAFAALAFNDRGIGFNLVVSSGQEIVTRMDDYIAYALDQPTTRVLALLLETVRDPEGFRAQLARAAGLGVPVIALKVGRTEASKPMVTAHSGALAGEHGAYEALFDAYGVLEARTLEDMADAMELFASPRRVRTGSGIASVHDSGGERALFADVAEDLGVPFASIAEATRSRIADVLDEGLVAENPLDAWGTGIDADRIFREAMIALHDDNDTAVVAFVVDLTRQGEPYDAGYLQVADEVFAATTKPFCVISNLPTAMAHEEATWLRARGIPVLEGTDSGLAALGMALRQRDVERREPVRPPDPIPADVVARWRERLGAGAPLSEREALALIADAGLPVVEVRPASSRETAVNAADGIGYPVVLKTAAAGVSHKSDVGGVVLGLADAAAVGAAYDDLAGRLGPDVLVAATAAPGVEVALGLVVDPQFGPLVLVAAGGVLVELLHDRTLAMPPLDRPRARALIDRLAIRPLLAGMRGRAAADIDALADALVRLGALAEAVGDLVGAVDVNPVIAGPGGCVAVDALVEPVP